MKEVDSTPSVQRLAMALSAAGQERLVHSGEISVLVRSHQRGALSPLRRDHTLAGFV